MRPGRGARSCVGRCAGDEGRRRRPVRPLAGHPRAGRPASRRPLPLAAVLVLSAALFLAVCAAAAPPAHANTNFLAPSICAGSGVQKFPTPVISVDTTSPTNLSPVPFKISFSGNVNPATIQESDITTTSGTVKNLRPAWRHVENFGSEGDGNGQFKRLDGIAVDNATGRIFVADTENDRVSYFDSSLNYEGKLPFTFADPSGVEVDNSGRIFVANASGSRVLIFDRALTHVATLHSTVNADGYHYGGQTLSSPVDMAIADEFLAVADAGHGGRTALYRHSNLQHSIDIDSSVLAFNSDYVRSVPSGVGADFRGNVFVSEPDLDRVRIAAPASNWWTVGFITGPFDNPRGVGADRAGRMYVADAGTDKVHVFDVVRQLPGPGANIDWATGATSPVANITGFNNPQDVTFYGSDRMYVADSGNHQVQVFEHYYAFDVEVQEGTFSVSMAGCRVQNHQKAAEGNKWNYPSNTASVTVDRTPQTPTVTAAQPSPTDAPTINFRVDWDEDVDGFTSDDVVILGTAGHGGVENFTGSGDSYSFDVSPVSDGTIWASVKHGAVLDPARNPSNAAWRLVVHDAARPIPAIAPAQFHSTALRDVPFSMGFDEPIDPATLEASDINATSGNVTNLRSVWTHAATFGGNGPGDGQLDEPHGVAVDAGGRVYVAEKQNGRVSVFDRAGNHLGHVGGPFLRPEDVAAGGPHGRVYVADTGNNTVRVYDAAWRHVHDIRNSFANPSGVAVDSSGNAYVAVRLNHTVQMFDPDGQYVRDVGGPYNQPNGIAVDSSGTVYVADSGNNTVRVYDAGGQPVVNITNSFAYPFAVDVDPAGNVFVADAFGSRVAVFDSAWQHVANLTHPYDPLLTVTGVGVDAATGDAYVAGRDNHRVSLFDAAYAFDVEDPVEGNLTVRLPAGSADDRSGHGNEAGQASIIVDRTGPIPAIAPATPGPSRLRTVHFNVTFDEPANATALDVSHITATSGAVRNLRQAWPHYGDFGAGPGSGNLSTPHGMAVDALSGRIYVSSSNHGRVEVFDGAGNHAGSLTGPLSSPNGIAVDGTDGTVYVADWDLKGVEVFDGAGNHAGSIAGPDGNPVGAAFDSHAGILYVAYPLLGRVHAFEGSTGSSAFSIGSFVNPVGVAVDGATGRIYVAQTRPPDAGGGVVVLGPDRQPVLNITGPLASPYEVAVDGPHDRIYVTHSSSRLSAFDGAGNHVADVTGPISAPTGVAVDGISGTVYVVSRNHGNVSAFGTSEYAFEVEGATDQQTLNVTVSAVAVHDALKNYGSATGAASVKIDRTPPRPDVTSPQTSPTPAAVVEFTIDWGEPVYGFDETGIEVSGTARTGGVVNFAATGAGGSDGGGSDAHEFAVAPAADGTITVDVTAGAARDEAGNPSAAGAFSIVSRNVFLTPVVEAAVPSPTNLQNVPFRIAFNKPVNVATLAASDIDASQGDVNGLRLAPQLLSTTLGGPAAPLDGPRGAAVHPGTGHVYVANTGNNSIDVFNSAGLRTSSIAGSLDGPRGVAVHPTTGHVYVANTGNNSIAIFNGAGGSIRNIAGSLSSPSGVAVHPTTGHVYVANTGNNSIAIFNGAGGSIGSIAGSLSGPSGVAVHPDTGHVYVANSGDNSIAVFDSARRSTLNITGLDNPVAVAVHRITGDIYVAEFNGDRIAVHDSAGRRLANITDSVSRPYAVALDGVTDTAYAVSSGYDRVTAFNTAAYEFGVAGAADNSTLEVRLPIATVRDRDGGASLASGTARIAIDRRAPVPDIALDHAGPTAAAYAVGFTVRWDEPVYEFNEAGIAVSGTGRTGGVIGFAAAGAGAGGDGEGRNSHTFAVAPTVDGTVTVNVTAGAARDEAGNPSAAVGLSTTAFNVVRLTPVVEAAAPSPTNLQDVPFRIAFNEPVDSSTLDASDIDASQGDVNGLRLAPQLLSATLGGPAAPLDGPRGAAVDGTTGAVYVANTGNNSIDVFSSAGLRTSSIAGSLDGPRGVAVHPGTGHVYVANTGNNSIAVFDGAGESIRNITHAFSVPAGVAVHPGTGHVYVTDTGNNRIVEFDGAGNRIHDMTLTDPSGVAVHPDSGDIYVAGSVNGIVSVFDRNWNSALNITGLDNPVAVAVHRITGDIYVAEHNGDRIAVHDSAGRRLANITDSVSRPYAVAVDGATGIAYAALRDSAHALAFDTAEYAFEVEGAADGSTLEVSMPAGSVRDGAGEYNAASGAARIAIDRTAPEPSVTAPQRGPAALQAVPLGLKFGEDIDPATLAATDINASSGDVRNLRLELWHNATIGGGAGAARLSEPRGVAADASSGLTYVADGAGRVLAFNSTGHSAGGLPGPFDSPSGVAVDASGSIYVANSGNGTVQIFNSSREPDGELPGPFASPRGIAVDASGSIYVANSGNGTVQIFNSSREPDGGLPGPFDSPSGVAVDASGSIYVANSGNGTVQIFNSSREPDGELPGPFASPRGVAADASGRIYVADDAADDAAASRVLAFNSSGSPVASASGFDGPRGVAVDSSGRIHVAEAAAGRVRILDHAYAFDVIGPEGGRALAVNLAAGSVLDLAGNANEATNTLGIRIDRTGPEATVAAAAAGPTGLRVVPFSLEFGEAVDAGTLAAADINASSGEVGNPRLAPRHNSTFGERGQGAGQFDDPRGVAVDGTTGAVYVADANNKRVHVFNSTLHHAGYLPGPFASPRGVAVDGFLGAVYVADHGAGRVLVFDSATGNHTASIADRLSSPAAVAIDPSGTIYVADQAAGRVQAYDLAAGHRIGALPGTFDQPSGVAVDGSTGAVYVADAAGVRVFDSSREPDGELTGTFASPRGVTVDGSGRVYVADAAGVRVFDSSRGPAGELPGRFASPRGVAVDGASGRVYVADAGIHGVLAFDAAYAFGVEEPDNERVLEVRLPAGSVRDAAGNENAGSGTASILVNWTGPIPKIASGQQSPTNASTIGFTVEFGENVTEFGAGDVALSGAATRGSVENFDGAGASYSFEVSPASDGTVRVDIPAGAARNALGNPSDAAERFYMAYDGTPPAAAVAAVPDGPTNETAVPFTLAFSSAVDASTLEASDVDASSGNATDLRAAWRHDAAFDGGPDRLSLPTGIAVDGSGNTYVADVLFTERVRVFDQDREYVTDITGPSRPQGVAVDGVTGDIYVTDAGRGTVRVYHPNMTRADDLPASFNTPVGVAIGGPHGRVHVVESGGNVHVHDPDGTRIHSFTGLSGPYGVAVDASGRVYVAERGNGAVRVYHPNGTQAGELPGQFSQPVGVAVDASGRVYVADYGSGSGGIGGASGPGFVRVHDPAGAEIAEIRNIPGGQLADPVGVAIDPASGALHVVDSGPRRIHVFDVAYAFSVENSTDLRTLTVSLPAGRVQDHAGNGNEESNAAGIRIDRTAPAPAISSTQPDPTGTSPILFTVEFGENVTGFDAGDVGLTGTANRGGALTVEGAGASYTFEVRPASNGTILVDIPENAAQDAAGNGNTRAEQFSIEYDSSLPTPTVTAAQRSPTNAKPISFQVNFSLPVTGFNASGIALSNTTGHGGVERFAGAGASYSFEVRPASDGTILVDIPAGAARSAGTGSIAALRFSITYDGTPPAPTVTAAQRSPTGESPIRFTVNFTESVDGLELADVALSGAAAGAANLVAVNLVAVNSTTYTFDVSPASDGTIHVDIPENAAEDDAGNGNTASERFSIEYDGTGPAPTVAAAQPGPTNATTIGFLLDFGGDVDPETVAASDISASSGNVTNLRAVPRHDGHFGGPGTGDGEFDAPAGVAAGGPSGEIYVADSGNRRVQIFDSSRRFAGTLPGPFVDPAGVAVDAASGRVYVADRGGFVAAFDAGRERLANITNASMTDPAGVAVDSSGNLYVADAGTGRLHAFNSSMMHVGSTAAGVLDGPEGAAADSAGRLYVAEPGPGRISVFDSATLASNGSLQAPPEFDFDSPRGVAVDGSGRVYVADTQNGRVRIFDPAHEYAGDLPGTFSSPYGVAAGGPSGGIYVAETPLDRIRAFDMKAYEFDVASPDAGHVLTARMPAGSVRDAVGNPNEESNAAGIRIDRTGPVPTVSPRDQSPATAATVGFRLDFNEAVDGATLDASDVNASSGSVANLRAAWHHDETFGGPGTGDGLFASPSGIAVDGSGNTYVADRGNGRVQVLGPARDHVASIGGLDAPRGVAVDAASGRVYVANTGNDSVRVYHPDRTYAADLPGSFDNPAGVAAGGPYGRIHVADTGNDRIRVYDFSLNHIYDIPGLDGPAGVAVDALGRVYVADTNASAVPVYPPNSIEAAADLPGPFDRPTGVAVDASGRVYVAETGGDGRVRIYHPDWTHAADIENPINTPYGVAVDPASGALYVTESAAGLIRPFDEAYDFDVEDPADQQTLTVRVPAGGVQDLAGNGNEESNEASISVIRDVPIPVVTSAQRSPTSESTIGFRVDFNIPVDGLVAGDIMLSNETGHGGVENFAGAGASYSFEVSPASDGTVRVDIPEGAAHGAAGSAQGNPSAAAERLTVTYDGKLPLPAVAKALDGPTNLTAVPFSLSFSENVNASTLVASDVDPSSGNVAELRAAWHPAPTFDGFGDGLFVSPSGIAVDGSGITYVADRGNDRVQVHDPAQDRVDGIGGLDAPRGVAVDAASGRVYVANTGNDSVRVYHPDRTYAADLPGSFDNPAGVAAGGPYGRIHVADTGNDRIRVYDFSLNHIYDIPGLDGPAGVAVDALGRVYVADTNASAVPVYPPNSIEAAADLPGPFDRPTGVAVDALGRVYVAETGGDGRVRIYHPDWTHAADIEDPINTPYGVAVDPASGALYVTESAAGLIRPFDEAYDFDVDDPDDQQTLTVRVPAGRVRDAAGNANAESNEESIRIDRIAPAPVINSTQPDPTGAPSIPFTVEFGESVKEFGADAIMLSNETGHRGVENFTGSGASYSFEVRPASDGTILVNIPENVVVDDAGNGNTASEPFSITYNSSLLTTTVTADEDSPTNAATITFRVVFSLPVTEFNASAIMLSNETGHRGVERFAGSGASYSFEVSPTSDGTIKVDIPAGAARSAGTDSTAAPQFSITYDGTRPIPRVTAEQQSPTRESPIRFTVNFTEPVKGFERPDVELSGNTISGAEHFDPVNATTYEFYVRPSDNGTIRVDIPENVADDDAGNGNTASEPFSIDYDSSLPFPTVTTEEDNPTSASPITFRVDFSLPVTGFAKADIMISGTADHDGVENFDPVSATRYEFDVSPSTNGTIIVDIPANAARDAADGSIGSAPAAQFSIEYDGEPAPIPAPVPTVTAAQSSTTDASPINFQVDFSRPVTGFAKTDIVISGDAAHGGIDNFAAVNTTRYTFEVSPSTNGTVIVDIPAGAAQDAADDSIGSAEAMPLSITYNGEPATVPPTPTPTPIPTVTTEHGSPTSASPITFRVDFSRPVTGFDHTGIVLSGTADHGGVENFVSVSATRYSFEVSPSTNGTVIVDIPANVARDAADGNTGNAAAEQFSITYNGEPAPIPPTTAPIPTVTTEHGSPTNASTITFRVDFSRPVTGFDHTGIVLSGTADHGGVENFVSVSATRYTFEVSPTSDGTILVDIPENAAQDTADGNTGSTAAEQFSIEYAAAAPGAELGVLSAEITGPQQATIRYDAAASAGASAYGPISIGGADRPVTLSGSGTETHVLRFGGEPAPPDATGSVTVDPAAVTGPAGNLRGDGAYRQELADGQAPPLASASLDLEAGENGRLALVFGEAAAAAPNVQSFAGNIVIRGAGGAVALSAADVPSAASGRAGDTAFALDVSGAKRVELNAADLDPATVELPGGFVSDASGNLYGGPAVPLAYAPDSSPPVLVAAAFRLAEGGGAGRLVVTFDEAVTAPAAGPLEGEIEVRGGSGAAAVLSGDDVAPAASGSGGDRTFALPVSDQRRGALSGPEFSDPGSTSVLLPDGFVTNGRAGYERERAPLVVARDSDGPSFLWAFVAGGGSVVAVYSEPVLSLPSHYGNITVDGAAAGGGGASGADAFGSNVVVSWGAGAAASAGSAVGFYLSADITDRFGNDLKNPGPKSTGGQGGSCDDKPLVRAGVFHGGPGDPSAAAARMGASAFNAVSESRGYPFCVGTSEYALPPGAGAAAAEAALRGAHAAGEGPLLYVGPASDAALAGMAGYASGNGITVISHSSAARSLAVEGDRIFRLEPGTAHLARALATEVALGGHAAVVPVVQAGLRGADYGLLGPLASDLGPLGIQFGAPVEFREGGAAAGPVEEAVARAAGSRGAGSVAVVYVGSDAELAALAGGVPPGSPAREAAWFAPGGAGAGAGDGVAASPAILADAAAIQLARDTRLSAVQFAVDRNGVTDYIDRITGAPAGSATPAYAAYEAVRVLGGALVPAGGDPSLAGGNVAGAANLEGGPLGRTGMDGSGDLRFPVTYGAWSVSGTAAEWVRAPDLLRGLDACGIDLEKSALALPPLTAGSTSRPVRQTVTNIGTGPMPAVSVSATDWTQLRGGDPIPGATLPFSYTEMAVGLDGASPRRADSTPLAAGTEIPGGTPPGGSVDVDFRINLVALEVLRADSISQTVTFVANCG